MEIQEIKAYMKENRITYDMLAERSGLSISTIKKIFSGISQYPRIDTMRAIERALGRDEPAETPADNELLALLNQMTEEEIIELTNYVDFIISKRK